VEWRDGRELEGYIYAKAQDQCGISTIGREQITDVGAQGAILTDGQAGHDRTMISDGRAGSCRKASLVGC
jgi:hypothetical protein